MSGQAQTDRHHERRWRILGVISPQQVGGSLGLALLSTLVADAVSGYTAAVGTPVALAQAEAAGTATPPRSGGRRASSPQVRS
jgi:hypothetical protein